jgi:hypothetical protein
MSKVSFLSPDSLRFYKLNYDENMLCWRVEATLLECLLWMNHPSTPKPQILLKRVHLSTFNVKKLYILLLWSLHPHDTYISQLFCSKVHYRVYMFCHSAFIYFWNHIPPSASRDLNNPTSWRSVSLLYESSQILALSLNNPALLSIHQRIFWQPLPFQYILMMETFVTGHLRIPKIRQWKILSLSQCTSCAFLA